MNISQVRFILFSLKIFGEIFTLKKKPNGRNYSGLDLQCMEGPLASLPLCRDKISKENFFTLQSNNFEYTFY